MEKEYQVALDYLFSQLPMFSRTGAPAYKPGLDTSINLAAGFGNPHKKFKSIHIGGTNGKGSTSHMIASVLQSQGYKVGLYTSPHLVDFRERIRINGRMIPKQKVVEFVDYWKSNPSLDLHPSFFELTMILAFDWFAKEKVDYAVIEVGMGGRLDSTNIITPLLSVITNISWDHNQFLGDTLEKIAGEKAGIIKSGVPVVIGETQPESSPVFLEKAREMNASIVFADSNDGVTPHISATHSGWCCRMPGMEFTLPLGGDYQRKNVVTALTALKALKESGIEISDKAVVQGMESVCRQTGLAGRWMIVDEKPLTIADTGHNLAGITYNIKQLRALQLDNSATLRIVIGLVADKAIDKILDLLPEDAIYYVTNAQIPRALPADKLLTLFNVKGFKAKAFPNVKEAYEEAKKEASEEDIIFIGGSTFIVADFLHYFSPCGGHES